jgi:hypothetical protein
MHRRHATILALMLAGGAATGVFAVTKTTDLGVTAAPVSDAEIARRNAELDEMQKKLEKALENRPPAIPARLKQKAGQNRSAVTGGGSTRIAYVTTQPAPAQVADQSTPHKKKGPKSSASGTATAAGKTTPAAETTDQPAETAAETGSSPAEDGGGGGGGTSTGSSPVAGSGGGNGGGEHEDGEEGGGDD